MRRLMIIVLLLASACGGGGEDKSASAVSPPTIDEAQVLAAAPPALAADVLRQLADPGSESKIDALAAEESSRRAKLLAVAEQADKKSGGPGKPRPVSYDGGLTVRPAAYRTGVGGGPNFVIAGAQLVTLSGGIGQIANPTGATGTITGESNGVGMTIDIDKTGTITTSIETDVTIAELFLEAGSKVTLRGGTCPDKDGKVEYYAEIKTSGKGKSNSYGKTASARVTATVDDNADIVEGKAELVQETTTPEGKVVTAASQEIGAGGKFGDTSFGVDSPSGMSKAQARQTAIDGYADAVSLAMGTLTAAESHWKLGSCVSLTAEEPGSVDPKSTTTVDVSVKSKVGNGSVPARVTIALSGEKEVDKTEIKKAPDSFVYTAPDDKDKEATIELKAFSKQGRASKTLKADTKEEDFKVSGPYGFATMEGTKCGGPFGTWNVSVDADQVTEELTWTFTEPSLTAQLSGTRVVQGYTFQESGRVTFDPEAGTLSFTSNSGGDASVPVTKGSFCRKS